MIKHRLYRLILSERIGEWAYALTEYDLTFEPLKTFKGQVIEHGIDLGYEINYLFVTHGGFVLFNRLALFETSSRLTLHLHQYSS